MLKQRLGDIPTYGFGPHPLRPAAEKAWADANPDEPDPELDAAIAAAGAEADAVAPRSAKARRASRLRLHTRRRRRRRRTSSTAPAFASLRCTRRGTSRIICASPSNPAHDPTRQPFSRAITSWDGRRPIVPPPDGDMVAYFTSLQRLLDSARRRRITRRTAPRYRAATST